jgi:hypothetical protein
MKETQIILIVGCVIAFLLLYHHGGKLVALLSRCGTPSIPSWLSHKYLWWTIGAVLLAGLLAWGLYLIPWDSIDPQWITVAEWIAGGVALLALLGWFFGKKKLSEVVAQMILVGIIFGGLVWVITSLKGCTASTWQPNGGNITTTSCPVETESYIVPGYAEGKWLRLETGGNWDTKPEEGTMVIVYAPATLNEAVPTVQDVFNRRVPGKITELTYTSTEVLSPWADGPIYLVSAYPDRPVKIVNSRPAK